VEGEDRVYQFLEPLNSYCRKREGHVKRMRNDMALSYASFAISDLQNDKKLKFL
jgi:hypothetical protein